MSYTYCKLSLVKIGREMFSVECLQSCYGRTDSPFTTSSLHNFVSRWDHRVLYCNFKHRNSFLWTMKTKPYFFQTDTYSDISYLSSQELLWTFILLFSHYIWSYKVVIGNKLMLLIVNVSVMTCFSQWCMTRYWNK